MICQYMKLTFYSFFLIRLSEFKYNFKGKATQLSNHKKYLQVIGEIKKLIRLLVDGLFSFSEKCVKY